jgi:GT2 family glycosyltransferase
VSDTSNSNPSLRCLEGWRKPGLRSRGLDDCTLVVATFKRPGEMVILLERLGGVPDPPGEVVVVDGSPEDSVGKAVSGWARTVSAPFDLVYVKSPAGLTRQRNVGVDASTGEFIFFLDDDCLPDPGYFREIRDVFRKDTAGEIAVVCGSIINEMGKPVTLRWRIRFLLRLVPRGESGKYYPTATSVPRSLVSPFSGIRPVDIVPGGATAYRRAVFDRHRFSEFFSGYAQGEDVEMSLRIGKEQKLVWCGDAHVNHYHAPGGRPASYQKGRMEVRNRFFIWKRYSPEPTLLDRLRFWLDVAYIGSIDVVTFLLRPNQPWYLSHALGVAGGSLECLIRPPSHQEPRATREYDFRLAPLPND